MGYVKKEVLISDSKYWVGVCGAHVRVLKYGPFDTETSAIRARDYINALEHAMDQDIDVVARLGELKGRIKNLNKKLWRTEEWASRRALLLELSEATREMYYLEGERGTENCSI